MKELSLHRLMAISFSLLHLYLIPSFAVGQLPQEQDKNLIVIAKRNLEQAKTDFKASLSKLEKSGLLKPESAGTQPIDQATWEKLPYVEGDLPTPVFEAFKIPLDQRSEPQKLALYHYYLSHVRKDTRSELESASNRIHWLERYVAASAKAQYDTATYQAAVELYYRQQYLDAYLFHTKDSPEVQKRAREIFRSMSVDRGKIQIGSTETRKMCSYFDKKKNLDPVLTLAKIDQRLSYYFIYENDPRGKQLEAVLKKFEELQYGPFLRFQARVSLRKWKMQKRRILLSEVDMEVIRGRDDAAARAFVKEVDDLADGIFQDAIQVMREAGDCPELSRALFMMMAKSLWIESNEQKLELLELVTDSDLKPWAKAFYLQFINLSLANSRSTDTDDKMSFVRESIKHGLKAHELLPLSPEPALRLMRQTCEEGTFAESKKWFHTAMGRQIDSKDIIENFFELANRWSEDPQTEVADLIVSLSNSQRYDLKIPDNVVSVLREFNGHYQFKQICKNEEVQKALNRVIEGRIKNGGDEDWVKQARQLQVKIAVSGEHFDRALAAGKFLEGDLGNFKLYRNRPLTLSRLACLGSEVVESVENKIDEGKIEPEEIVQTIEELEIARQDLGTIAGSYTDELILLLESILHFESGDWAELTNSNEHMLFWRQNRYYRKVLPLDDGVRMNDDWNDLNWRWSFDSPYVLEADIHFVKDEKGKMGSTNAGFRTFTDETAFIDPKRGWVGLSNVWPNGLRGGSIRGYKFESPMGGNRVRVRVWSDYCDFSIDNKELLHQAKPFKLGLGARLRSTRPNAEFRNVKIRKLQMKSPLKFDTDPIKYWTSRIKNEPDAGELYNHRAGALIKSGIAEDKEELWAKAIQDLRRSVELSPNSPTVIENLVNGLAQAKRYADAKKEAVAGVEKFPKSKDLKIQLAALECTSSDPDVLNGEHAVEVAQGMLKNPRGLNKGKLLELVAAAHAQTGDFTKAIKFQKEGIAPQSDKRRPKRTLELYKKKKALRVNPTYFSNRPVYKYGPPDQFDEPRKAMEVTDGLVRHWDFDQSVDEKVTDTKGTIVGGARLVGSRRRGALMLGDGRNGYLLKTNSKPIDQYEDFTISFWLYRTNSQGGLLSISPESSDTGLFLYLRDEQIGFRFEQHQKLSTKVISGKGKNKKPLKIPGYRWMNFTLTYDSKKSQYQTWINGAKATQETPEPNGVERRARLDLDSLKVNFGNSRDYFGFAGMLDEVRFYDRVLSDKEIKTVTDYRP